MAVCVALLVPLMLLLISNNAAAKGVLGEINIRLSGNIVALACTVEPADVTKTINLGNWTTKQLRNPSGHSEPVAFSIHLTGCTASGVTLAFTGTKDTVDSTLLALSEGSTASGVAVEIMNAAHKRIAMGESAERVVVDSQGAAVLNFFARYQAVATPIAGTAYADSEFILAYD